MSECVSWARALLGSDRVDARFFNVGYRDPAEPPERKSHTRSEDSGMDDSSACVDDAAHRTILRDISLRKSR
jgi:hypothetical protein